MPAYPFNPSALHWNPPGRSASSFRPRGPIAQHGARPNPEDWESTETISARVIVGFSVGQVPTWSLDDLIPIVERVRRRQAGAPDSTFVSQRGIYTHHDGSGTVTEDGAQVFVINLSGASLTEFRRQMVELAEIIAREFQQESVIVEIQVNGVSKATIGVIP